MAESAVGFVGLGRMGFGMARNLGAADVPLRVWDPRPEPVRRLAEVGGRAAADVADLVREVAVLFVCVPSEVEAEQVLFGPRGVVAGLAERSDAAGGLTVVDTTTMNHGAALDLASRAEAAGLTYCDCPISGMPFRADDGTLTMMFGGEAARFEATRPWLEVMGKFIVHCGPAGSGQLMKAVNNIIYDVNIAAFCEVLPLAVKAGLSAETLERVLTTASSRSFASEYFVPRILDGRFEGDFSLQGAHKDLVNIEQVAERYGAELPVVAAMMHTYREAIAQGLGDEPKSAMVKLAEARLQQTVRRPGV